VLALKGEGGRGILANYGLRPSLGRYYRSYCDRCDKSLGELPPPVLACPECGEKGRDFTLGVADRVEEICPGAAAEAAITARPSYQYQVPLSYLEGFGRKTIERLLGHLGSEMVAMHEAPRSRLAAAVGYELADRILAARAGTVKLNDGGGGRYGSVETGAAELGPEAQLSLFP
jgi:PHP family Zn ribbon phosphoesterase